MIELEQDTICAISTPQGIGGIAIVRVSGFNAITICDKVFTTKNQNKCLTTQKSHTIRYGSICSGDNLIDDVLISVFRRPHSFTGEDSVEIACHGSIYIQQQILQLLVDKGCRLALPGEFTQRAFINGKMDLSQAEAVADLIASTSAGMHKLALNQMRGGFSNELTLLRNSLLDFTSLIELELDFSEEDVEFADRTVLKQLAEKIEQIIRKLAESFSVGNAIKNGIPVAIIGETNAGKSTLLNLLIGEERAIVSEIHGTTRDTIEDTINLAGITFRFIDTAGIRNTNDTIERLGIERTYQKIEQATIVLWVIDLTQTSESIISLAEKLKPRLENKQTFLVFNKSDLASPDEVSNKQLLSQRLDIPSIFISAQKRQNTDRLQEILIQSASLPSLSSNEVIVTNVRHYEALKKAQSAILRVSAGLQDNISGDFLSQDIRECMHYIGEITGQITNDEILGNIFGKFCIGK